MESILERIFNDVIDGEQAEVEQNAQKALEQNIPPARILNEGLIAAMTEVGRRFEEGDYYVPEMLIAARAMQAGLAVLKPHLLQEDIKSSGKVAMGTVSGDLHDIGKNLVVMMLEGAGFEVTDLGTDVPVEKFVEAVRSGKADIIGMSALLTTTMSNMKTTVESLVEAGLREKVKIIIGGAPVTDEYAKSIGADGYAPDASRAVALAKTLMA